MSKEMDEALEADGKKLRGITGEDHGPHFIYVDDVTVPRALLVLCLDLLESASRYTGFDGDYDLAVAQLREHLK